MNRQNLLFPTRARPPRDPRAHPKAKVADPKAKVGNPKAKVKNERKPWGLDPNPKVWYPKAKVPMDPKAKVGRPNPNLEVPVNSGIPSERSRSSACQTLPNCDPEPSTSETTPNDLFAADSWLNCDSMSRTPWPSASSVSPVGRLAARVTLWTSIFAGQSDQEELTQEDLSPE